MTRRALITGITGQDGSYLAELLLDKGYEVHGVIRRASSFNTARIEHLYQDPHEARPALHLHYADLTDGSRLANLLQTVAPDEVYNLGGAEHVRVSFEMPEFTGDITGAGHDPAAGGDAHDRAGRAGSTRRVELRDVRARCSRCRRTSRRRRSTRAVAVRRGEGLSRTG